MTQVSFRVDENLKAEADRLFKSMGMNTSVAITIFFQQTIQRGKLPFEVLGDPFYGEANIRELERRAREMDAGHNTAEHETIDPGVSVHA